MQRLAALVPRARARSYGVEFKRMNELKRTKV